MSGKVLWSQDGLPMANAVVYLNGREVAKSAEDGLYNLESMRAGTYKMKVIAGNDVFYLSYLPLPHERAPYPVIINLFRRNEIGRGLNEQFYDLLLFY